MCSLAQSTEFWLYIFILVAAGGPRYVIVSREGLPNLPYSITEIYGIRMSGRYGGLKQHYNEFYRIYGNTVPEKKIYPKTVVTEDSNAGYQFFQDVCKNNGITCLPAGGKSKLLHTAKTAAADGDILLIADGAAFGAEMNRVMKFLKGHQNVKLYAPESFEWLILSANPIKDASIRSLKSLRSTSNHPIILVGRGSSPVF